MITTLGELNYYFTLYSVPVKPLGEAIPPEERDFLPENPSAILTGVKLENTEKETSELTLGAAITIALENNPDLDSMVKSVEKSRYLHTAARKEWMPVISTDYSFTGFPEEIQMIMDGEEFPVMPNTEFVWGVHAKMPLYTAGATQYKETIAKLGIDVSRWKYLEAKSDLIQEVTVNFLTALRCGHYRDVSRENLIRYEKHEEITKKFFEALIVPKNTLLEIQAKSAGARQELIVAKKNLKLSKSALNVSMGLDVDTPFALRDITERRDWPLSYAECLDIASENNPSLVAYRYIEKTAKYKIELAKTDSRPQVTGQISYYRHGKTPELAGDDFFTNNNVVGMIVAKWDVFDWLKTKDLTDAKKKELEILIDRRGMLGKRVSYDVKKSFLSLEAAKSMFFAAEEEVRYAKENYRISRLRYKERVGRSIEVNNALVLFKKAQYRYYSAFYDYNAALAKLERVMGTNIKFR